MSLNTLLDALLEEQPSPCQKYECDFRDKCSEERLACSAFRYYVSTGRAADPRIDMPERVTIRWSPVYSVEPKPSRGIFDSMSDDDGDSRPKTEKEAAEKTCDLVAWALGNTRQLTDDEIDEWLAKEAA
jgi:hypothetical protein